MHAGRKVMRSVGKLARHHAASEVGAVLLLAVLVAHLAFMVSPLHTLMLAEGSHAVSLTSMAASGNAAAPTVHDPADAPEGHCGIRWTNAGGSTVLFVTLAVALAGALPVLDQHVAGMRPIARALGPPLVGDSQALLQVFRL